MVRMKNNPGFVDQLKKALVEGLAQGGIKAKVQVEPVRTTKLFRLLVLAPQFAALKHSERQDLVWRIAERVLSPEQQLQISMILTMTDKEAAGKEVA